MAGEPCCHLPSILKLWIKPSSQAHVLSSPRAGCSYLAVPETASDKPGSPSMLDWAGLGTGTNRRGRMRLPSTSSHLATT